MPRSKRYEEAKKLIDRKKVYPRAEAIELAKKTSTVKFDAAVEAHFQLGIDPAKGEQQIRSTIIFPHSIGKERRVAAFVAADREAEAKAAGADIIGGDDMIEKIKKSEKIDFDVAVATPDMMPKLAKIAKILGPKGLMPNPKTDTVGPNVKKMIEEIKRGKITFKNDATANVHQTIGKVSLDSAKLLENLNALIEAVLRVKPPSSKGEYVKSATIATSMGPGIKFEI
ncbi:MAG: 50S ribosomal protein L1 [Patescibacteria group bacterium]|nr:50S ribosomal protein L1 [Patescibacteria group bacterium]